MQTLHNIQEQQKLQKKTWTENDMIDFRFPKCIDRKSGFMRIRFLHQQTLIVEKININYVLIIYYGTKNKHQWACTYCVSRITQIQHLKGNGECRWYLVKVFGSEQCIERFKCIELCKIHLHSVQLPRCKRASHMFPMLLHTLLSRSHHNGLVSNFQVYFEIINKLMFDNSIKIDDSSLHFSPKAITAHMPVRVHCSFM